MLTRTLYCSVALALAGCSFTPSYVRPALDVPAAFRFNAADARAVASLRWWENFNDPVLSKIIDTALERNLDLRNATALLLEYQANVTSTRSSFFPQVDLSTSAGGNVSSGSTLFDPAVGPIADKGTSDRRFIQTKLSVNWELDLWGKIRDLSDAARAEYLGKEESRRAVVLTLVSTVARTYIELRELDRRLEIANLTLAARNESSRLANLRFKAGVVSLIDVKQAEVETQSTIALVKQAEQAVAQKENELSLFLGQSPRAIERGLSLEAFKSPAIPAGLPSDLLSQRPDLRQAEQELIAANARIGAAKASRLPTISLTGSYGGTSNELSTLLKEPFKAWNYGPTLSVPLFDAARLSSQVDMAVSRQQQAALRYEKAFLSALRETDDALVAVEKIKAQKEAQLAQVDAVRKYAKLARTRYVNGISSYLEVLDAQRSLLNTELGLVQSQSASLQAMISLYNALGGNWIDESKLAAKPVN